jgi:uncharacterized HAD superfamily protein
MDGVICRDPTRAEIKDDRLYQKFLESAEPLIIPTMPIRAIVTGRQEFRREQTEAWLSRYSIEYENLIMRPDASIDIATYKAIEYTNDDVAQLFIESNAKQAAKIAEMSKKPVFCITEGVYYEA